MPLNWRLARATPLLPTRRLCQRQTCESRRGKLVQGQGFVKLPKESLSPEACPGVKFQSRSRIHP